MPLDFVVFLCCFCCSAFTCRALSLSYAPVRLQGTAKAAVEDDRQHAEALLELLPARIWRAGPGAGLPARRVLLTAAVLLREYARGRLCRVCCKRVPRDARWCAAELCLYAGITLPAYHTPHLHMPGAAPFVRAAAGAALAVMSNASHTRSGVYNGAAAGAVAEVTATANAARDALLMPVPVDYQVVIDGAAATGAAASSAAATSAAAAGGAGAAVAATSSASAGGRAAAAAASIKTVNVAQLSADLASLLLRGPSLASATTPAAMVRWAMSEPDERYLPKAPPPEVGDGAVVVDAADTSAAAGSSATAVASAAVPAAGAAAGGAGARAAAAAVPPSGAAAAAVAGSMADSMTAQQATRAAVVELSRAPEHARRLVALVWWLLNSPRCRYRVLTPAEDAFAAAAANAAAPVPEAAARGWAGAAASEGAAAAPSLLFPSFDRAAGHYSYSHSSSGSGSSSAAAGEAVETVVVALEDEAVEARMAALPAGDPGAGEPYAGQGTAEKPPSSWIARPCTLWHGMPASRAFSVVRNGLFVFSNTSWMLVGATYGAGIYSSNSTATCAGYSPAASAVVSVPELTAINDATAAAAEAAYRESIGAGAPLASGSGIGSSSLSSDGRLPSYVGPPPTMHVTVPAGNMARLFVAPYCAVKGTENIYVVKRENRFRITHLLLAVPTVKVAGMLPR